MVIKATKVDGIYDSDPAKNHNAKKYTTIAHQKVIEDNLRIMDLTAIAMAKDNKLPIFVCKIDEIEKLSYDDMSF
jgi:uridylate kinase